MQIFGFSLLRNGVKYDYSFRESLISLRPLTDKIFLALGESEDNTEEVVSKLDGIKIFPTIWDEESRSQGLILSSQTNFILNELRTYLGSMIKNSWGIYLQADEVFHQDEYEIIRHDINEAHKQGYDAVRFRYLHFWEDHNHIAINKKWYPSEIRAFNLDSEIESWGDAQSFRGAQKIYESEAHVFHFGHVRNLQSYLKKKEDFLKLYHSDDKLPKYQRRERRYDKQTKCLLYFGPYPSIMKKRVASLEDVWERPMVDDIYILGRKDDFDKKFLSRIKVKNIHFSTNRKDFKGIPPSRKIIINPTFLEKLFKIDNIPDSMLSPLARPWTLQFKLILKLSEKGIGFFQEKQL